MNKSNILSIQSMLRGETVPTSTNKTFVGIDFGTSTTVVSIATYDHTTKSMRVEPIRIDQLLEDCATRFSSEKIPTVIAWHNNRLLVGEGASNLKYSLRKGKNIWFSFKMEIGEDLGAKYYNSEVGDIANIRIRNPKDCVRIFFMYLKLQIDKYCETHNLSKDICYAVSIPASFEANQRKELMEALETNGMSLTKQSLIDEPNAAFISYVHESQTSERPLLISPHYNSKCLVFDYGGGTCDISILEIGKSVNGLYSKNVAISKFAKVGGDDLGRYLTFKYLLPRFLAHNGYKPSDLITKERSYIATQLYKVAERLKILLCRSIANKTYDMEIPDSCKHDETKMSIDVAVEIDTIKGKMSQSTFYLTPAELSGAMSVFMRKSSMALQVKGEDDYNSIFMPIESAIKKSKVKVSEIDYVLLIGGSAQNPFIQEALKKHFTDSQILVPQNLQTHVSQGAAMHSLLMNGMKKCIIQPITSEPILVITKDMFPKILLPAGSTIPSDTITIDDLVTSREGQDTIELPLCVGTKDKMLFNLKISSTLGFPVNTPIHLAIEVNADKLLLARAECSGISCMIEPQNPFANKELTTEERLVLIAERQANLEAEQNGGTPTKDGLIRLKDAYLNAGNDFRAAETYEQMLEMYPSGSEYNTLGVLYHNAGVHDKAESFFELALLNNPDDFHVKFNLGNTVRHTNPKKAEKYLRMAHEQRPDHVQTLIALSDFEEQQGRKTKATEMRQKAFDVLYNKWRKGTIEKFEYSWLIYVAKDLGKNAIANEVRVSQPQLETDKYYNDDNLARQRVTELTIK